MSTPTAAPHAPPLQECDLVMKGGVTSGIVYPPAVLHLSRTYRFRCIGGTSAGAIAAAVTAAAEFGRESGGFAKLEQVGTQLGKGTFLRDLFQPSPQARPLLDALLATVTDANAPAGSRPGAATHARRVLSLLRHYAGDHAERMGRRGSAVGFVVALVLALLVPPAQRLATGTWDRAGWTALAAFLLFAAVLGMATALLGYLAGAARDLGGFVQKDVCTDGGFGLCSGSRYPHGPADAPPVLTDWLHETINRVAGRKAGDGPLTFGELDAAGIRLRMVTSNLSQSLPYVLPFTNLLIFRDDELSRLFPPAVMDHLRRVAHRSESVTLPPGYLYFPRSDDFPVVVATRLSLSFPGLIGTVPLYTVKRDAWRRKSGDARLVVTEADLHRHLFSDGGIASNFPIHFFDEWFPGRPTFGITLATVEEKEADHVGRAALSVAASVEPDAEGHDVSPDTERGELYEDVYIARANSALAPTWRSIDSVPAFVGAIFTTAQNYRDTLQGMLPSYRERVATIRLTPDEGGLNLAMTEEKIAAIMAKGAQAGEKLAGFRLDEHQWVRMLVLMAQLEERLRHVAGTRGDADRMDVDALFARVKQARDAGTPFPYSRSDAWCQRAAERMNDLLALAETWEQREVFTSRPPKPEPVLRTVPEL